MRQISVELNNDFRQGNLADCHLIRLRCITVSIIMMSQSEPFLLS